MAVPSTSTVQKPIVGLGRFPNRWVADRRPPAPSAGVERLREKFNHQASLAHALKLASFRLLEQPRGLRPCLTGVATRPPVAILSRTVAWDIQEHGVLCVINVLLAAVFRIFKQTVLSTYEAGLRLLPGRHSLAIPPPLFSCSSLLA